MILAVAAAGSVGAILRYLVHELLSGAETRVPVGTAVINLVGAVALGVLIGFDRSRSVSDDLAWVVGVGLLGGFTTFPTWMLETAFLARRPHPAVALAVLNTVGLAAAGVAGAAVGVWAGGG